MAFKLEEITITANRFNDLATHYSFRATDLEKEWSRNGRRLTRDEARWLKQLHKMAKEYRIQSESCQNIFDGITTRNFNSVQKEQSL